VRETLSRFASLRQILLGMEQDLGLSGLGEAETLVLCAAAQVQGGALEIALSSLQKHPMTQDFSRSTFFRAINTLVEHGFLVKAGPEKRSGYFLNMKD
jgi:DNA-binding IclR family transcriptional regulator